MQLCTKVSAPAILALSLFVARGIAVAAEHVDRMALGGRCTDDSFIAEGETGNDLRGRRSRFFCDTVGLIFYDNPRHMLISFSDKRSHHPRPLVFSTRPPIILVNAATTARPVLCTDDALRCGMQCSAPTTPTR